jgi:UDP-3-O-[3-hydroxymyristoyl] glucosamine N-acyltransferase
VAPSFVTVHTVRSLAGLVGGLVLGDGGDTVITGVGDLKTAGPSELSFLGNAKYEPQARASRAGAILATEADAAKLDGTRIQVESPSAAFGRITPLFAPPPVRHEPGVHPTAVVAPDAILSEGVSIQPHAVIGASVRIGAGTVVGANCFIGEHSTIGENCLLHPLVTLRERSVLGARVIIHSGAVIGSDGFGYNFEGGRYVKIEHTGHVQIDDDVEIGANTTIDKARFGKTHIGEGVKIDNLVMIAHNVVVGPHCVIVGQVGISGSTTLGRYVTLAGQAGLAGHISIGDRAVLTAQSGVTKDVPPGAVMSGSHARPAREFLKLEALTTRLPDMLARIKELEKKVGLGGEPASP